ncbi:ABC transporter ATP-binding protein [Luteirhabdus pelagi]|uniref:ABC transporter ATP-binding protein n=1 Tax=Luteirhabdus pelagi TaxID=2792783 RepID=UPI0019397FEC|nr:ABC transporter ATP-binding protein [Luteirhabdus pelagi]
MSKTILKAENISKQYRLGLVGTGSLMHDVNRWWHRIRGKEDPYLKVGAVNDRSAKATEEYVWALKDINFEVQEGEVLGIIGKNGAGKSTLLKLLSRVTSPTTGTIKSRGRIASLLEVGTGFHPELTGRENIYLNGAILGMTKAEIDAKVDEIIEFSGCEMYIDTPTKRYSSGMTVRLGFAVAAHLEPDILVVDEVLAVGDAEFQKKAIGKMQDISSGEGRTVLFVSHNMVSVQSLCTRAIVLVNGKVDFEGSTANAIQEYLKEATTDGYSSKLFLDKSNTVKNKGVELLSAQITNGEPDKADDPIRIDTKILMQCEILVNDYNRKINIGFQFLDDSGNILFTSHTRNAARDHLNSKGNGKLLFKGIVPEKLFNEGEFYVNIFVVEDSSDVLIKLTDRMKFTVIPMAKKFGERMGKSVGVFKTDFEWMVQIP